MPLPQALVSEQPVTIDLCPWCEQPIPHEKFEEICRRLEEAERERTAEVEERLKAEVAEAKAEVEERARAEVARVQTEAEEAIQKANQDLEARLEAEVESARNAAEAALGQKLAVAEKAKADAEKEAEELKSSQERVMNQRLQEQRAALEKDKADALNAERAKNFEERQKLDEKLESLQRQLQKKTADELGEGAEIDLLEALKEAFPEDRITRVGKGKEGADIRHRIVASGQECGSIVYDSKNRTAWRNNYVTKLRKDQLAAQAEHSILASQVFPAGTRQLHVQDGVIIANPARVVALVDILRRAVIQVHTLRLSNHERGEKTEQLYEFITSDRCGQLLDHIDARSLDILELDVKEKKAHDQTWKRRGELVRAIQQAQGDISYEIDRIVTGSALQLVR